MAAKLTQKPSNKATPAKANKEKMQRWRRSGGAGTPAEKPPQAPRQGGNKGG